MPPNYNMPDGKPFGNVYFAKAAEKSDTKIGQKSNESSTPTTSTTSVTSRERCVIMQAAQKPPYFFLQMQDDKLDVSPGEVVNIITVIIVLKYFFIQRHIAYFQICKFVFFANMNNYFL